MSGAPAFSHHEYMLIIERYRSIACDFNEVHRREAFAIIRHDIEFSMIDAVALARLDASVGIRSTFFVQTINGAYNPLSKENRRRISEIRDLGHHVGLHLYVSHLEEGDERGLLAEIDYQRTILEVVTGMLDRFSFHRPPHWVLKIREDHIHGLINAYGPSFFELSTSPTEIKYIADSAHKWSYGHPLRTMPFDKFQILLHPDEWSTAGGDTETNFRRLFRQREAEFRDLVSTECKHFATVAGAFAG